MTDEPLHMWTIYNRPIDYPMSYVARLFLVTGSGVQPTRSIVVKHELDGLRDHFMRQGLACIPRAEEDDPVIVETWL